eukprot:CAMPEP_0172840608 /NCGR_PEP_ID=MMETSP1075-20121228/29439_1 /TAXON_ID=2916 /ORGANISM="Ceratium fusus, Strain PA161109" /LENGTH=302 /DNA_ID=CAMNT_0013684471 /DNA_START=36 /DNA_END=944 /DNA_ORIENTATION=+
MVTLAAFHECGPVGVVVQKQRRGIAMVGVFLGLFSLFSLFSDVRHASQGCTSGECVQLLNRDLKGIVQTHFHGAQKIREILPKVLKALKPYALKPRFEMYSISLCPDEINKERTTLSTLLNNHYDKVFRTGGVGGMPFAGKTGFMSVSHRVPTDGHLVVMFGPHLGLSPDGEPGKLMQFGQAAVANACAAVAEANERLTSGDTMRVDAATALPCGLGEQRAPKIEIMAKATKRVVPLHFKLYKVIEQQILTVANTNYGTGKLVLLGGITINMPHPMPGYFLPLHFSIRSEGQMPVDLMRLFS